MDDDEGMEIDPAMAAAMGFSSFGMKPGAKRKHHSNDEFVDPAVASQTETLEKGQTSKTKAAKLPTNTNVGPKSNAGSNAPSHKPPAEATLEELRNGVSNENGDMVYFMPSFLEDPWKDLKPK